MLSVRSATYSAASARLPVPGVGFSAGAGGPRSESIWSFDGPSWSSEFRSSFDGAAFCPRIWLIDSLSCSVGVVGIPGVHQFLVLRVADGRRDAVVRRVLLEEVLLSEPGRGRADVATRGRLQDRCQRALHVNIPCTSELCATRFDGALLVFEVADDAVDDVDAVLLVGVQYRGEVSALLVPHLTVRVVRDGADHRHHVGGLRQRLVEGDPVADAPALPGKRGVLRDRVLGKRLPRKDGGGHGNVELRLGNQLQALPKK